jgi:hypothetical protein
LYILFLYVDNILLFADEVEIQREKASMMKEFQWITLICDKVPSNLDINIEVQTHKVVVGMIFYIERLLLLQVFVIFTP